MRTESQEKLYSMEIGTLNNFRCKLEAAIEKSEAENKPYVQEKDHALWEAVNACYWSIEALKGHTLDLKLFEGKRVTMFAFISNTVNRITRNPEVYKDCADTATQAARILGKDGPVTNILAEIEMRELTLGNKKWSREDESMFSEGIKKALELSTKEDKT